MEIRESIESDIPAIVDLLKASLGEHLMPKSETFWRWKHMDNPFGKSPVLLAFENDLLIGVRAFMRWEWRQGNRTYKALRAVDTATHPEYQGKGIFKTLTLRMVQQSRNEGCDFIFNTPNKISKPGYLKMGWMNNGKMRVYINPVFIRGFKPSNFESMYAINKNGIYFNEVFNNSRTSLLTTAVNEKFLNWRYGANPNISYYSFHDSKINPSYLTIFRLKQKRFGIELRICEAFHTNDIDRNEYKKHLKKVVEDANARIVSSAYEMNLFPTLAVSAGPEITTHPLTFDHNFLTFDSWKPSLGDMEVF